MRYKGLIIASCAALVAAGATGCGSSSTKATAAASKATVANAAAPVAPKGSPIVLGTICSCTGPEASLLKDTGKVQLAWAQQLNAAGGINGHPVRLIVKDDGGTPATSLQAAKELIDNDHVMAIVGDTSLADAAFAPLAQARGVPVIGGTSVEPSFLSNPDFFPSGTQLVVVTIGTAGLAKQADKTHFGVVYCAEAPICAQLDPLGKGAAALSGLKFSSGKISATAPSYAAPCLQLKSEGVDALYVAQNPQTVLRFVDGCAQQGYKPQYVFDIAGLSNAVVGDTNLHGTLLDAPNANPYDVTTPAVAQFQTALRHYAPGIVGTSSLTYPLILGWSGDKLFEAAAQVGHLGPTSTSAEVKRALYSLKNETLGGLAPPLNFTPGKPAFIPCYFTEKLDQGQFTSLKDNQPTCLSPTQTKALATVLSHG